MSNVAEILKTWSEYFQIESILSTVLRSLGWGIIKALAAISSVVEGIATSIYGILPTLLADSGFEKILSDFRPLLIVILGLAITFLGYLFIFKRPDSISGHQIFQNFMLIFLTVTVMPLMAGQVANFTTSAADEIFNTFEKDGIAVYQVVDNNLVDMRLLLEQGKITAGSAQRDAILKNTADCNVLSAGKEAVSYIQINEVLDYDNDDYPAEQENLISQKISVNTNGILTTVKMNRGFFDIGHEYYYRYHINWGNLILTLGIVAVTYVLAALKLSMIVWEVFLDLILSPFIAVTDLAGGQRIKEFLRNLLSLLAIICVISLLLGGYGLGLKLLSGLDAAGKLGTGLTGSAMYLLLLAGLSWVVIFGPNIVEKIFGVDAGLHNSYGVYRAMKDVAAMPGKAVKKTASVAKAGGRLLSGGGSREKNHDRHEKKGASFGSAASASSTERASASREPKQDKEEQRSGPRIQTGEKSRMTVDSKNRESASRASEQASKDRSETSSRSALRAAQNVSSSSSVKSGMQKNLRAETSAQKNGNRHVAVSAGTSFGRSARSSERGIPSSSLQRASGNPVNIRSPQGGNVSALQNQVGKDNTLNHSTAAGRIRPEMKNLRESKPFTDIGLQSRNIQKTTHTESSNRIIQNLKNETLQTAVGTSTAFQSDAQNFGKRKPKRK